MYNQAFYHSLGVGPEAWLAAIIESSDDAILSKTLDGVITSWNGAAERMFGFTAHDAIGKAITIIIPDDHLSEEIDILAKIGRGERVDHFETTRQRRDGSLIEVSVTVSPVRDDAGVIRGASKILRDITDRRQAEERQNLLLREMNHRIKNLFAVTAGLVNVSARGAESKDELATALSDRISSLARAYALTLPDPGGEMVSHSSTTLIALLHAILQPYPGQFAIELEGGDVPIGSTPLSTLALMLHEFTTNAVKYGALASADGRLTVHIATAGDLVTLVWTEKTMKAPALRSAMDGFGAKLEIAALRSLDATLERQWQVDGLIIELTIPIERMA